MLGSNSITLTISGSPVVFNKVNDSEPYSATYFHNAANKDFTINVKHTVPKTRGASKESHMIRLDANHYDATDGTLLRTNSNWVVVQTVDGTQEDFNLSAELTALITALDATAIDELISRLS